MASGNGGLRTPEYGVCEERVWWAARNKGHRISGSFWTGGLCHAVLPVRKCLEQVADDHCAGQESLGKQEDIYINIICMCMCLCVTVLMYVYMCTCACLFSCSHTCIFM